MVSDPKLTAEEFKVKASNGEEFTMKYLRKDSDYKAWYKSLHDSAATAETELLLQQDYCKQVAGRNNDVVKVEQEVNGKIKLIMEKLKKDVRGAQSKPDRTARHSRRKFKGSVSEGGSAGSARSSRSRLKPTPPPMEAWASQPELEDMSDAQSEAKVSPLTHRTRTPRTPQIQRRQTGGSTNEVKLEQGLGEGLSSRKMSDLEECKDITKEKLIEHAQRKINNIKKTARLLIERLEASATTSTGNTRDTFIKYLDPLSGEDEKSEEACYPQDWGG